jgi:hypothetical protein
MTYSQDKNSRTFEEDKRRAWRGLGRGLLWSTVLLLAVGLALAAILNLNDLLPVWLGVVLFLFAVAVLLEGVFLHPLLHALAELFRVYIGRHLWRFALVRWLICFLGIAFAAYIACSIYQGSPGS